MTSAAPAGAAVSVRSRRLPIPCNSITARQRSAPRRPSPFVEVSPDRSRSSSRSWPVPTPPPARGPSACRFALRRTARRRSLASCFGDRMPGSRVPSGRWRATASIARALRSASSASSSSSTSCRRAHVAGPSRSSCASQRESGPEPAKPGSSPASASCAATSASDPTARPGEATTAALVSRPGCRSTVRTGCAGAAPPAPSDSVPWEPAPAPAAAATPVSGELSASVDSRALRRMVRLLPPRSATSPVRRLPLALPARRSLSSPSRGVSARPVRRPRSDLDPSSARPDEPPASAPRSPELPT